MPAEVAMTVVSIIRRRSFERVRPVVIYTVGEALDVFVEVLLFEKIVVAGLPCKVPSPVK